MPIEIGLQNCGGWETLRPTSVKLEIPEVPYPPQPESEAGITEDQWMVHSFSASLKITKGQCDNSKQSSRQCCFTQRRVVFFRPLADGC